METVWVGLGANMGDRLANLGAALREIRRIPGSRLAGVSPVYLSSPVGMRRQPWFFNAAARMKTTIAPHRFLKRLLDIERRLGRVRTGVAGGPRVIDLDLLMYGEKVVTGSRITVPHPRFHERAFALAPCADIAPDLRHPVLEIALCELLRDSRKGISLTKLDRRQQSRFRRLAGGRR